MNEYKIKGTATGRVSSPINLSKLVAEDRPDPKVIKIGYWYSRHDRAWVVQALDAEGNQIGDAEYEGTKKGRDFAIKHLMIKHGCNISAHLR